MGAKMTVSHAFFMKLSMPLVMLSGCVGIRTPLDDGSTKIGVGPDSAKEAAVEVAASRDSIDSIEAACGGAVTINTRPIKADILILLDRSESMTWSISEDQICSQMPCTTRAQAVVPAVSSLVTDNPDINWGLGLFPYPDNPTCGVASKPQVAIGPDSASAIRAQLASFTTAASTPTAAAIHAATNYLMGIEDGRKKAILLATDGYPTCGYPDSGKRMETHEMMSNAVDAATVAKQAGFPVYVIGIGQSMINLDSLARAGGTGNSYLATSTKELNNVLRSITSVFFPTCTFRANMIPPDKALANVYVDNQPVARDDSNGWMFDPQDETGATILLTGTYCQDMMAGANAQVQIVFSCRLP
jgi:hypothetical protein